MRHFLECRSCGKRWGEVPAGYCPHCGGVLTVEYEAAYLEAFFRHPLPAASYGIFTWAGVLPEIRPENRVTGSEGGTPLLRAGKEFARLAGLEQLFWKDETKNMTGSFKDRPVALCVSLAREYGVRRVVVASSGNGAAAVAAYSARAGLENEIFVPQSTPMEKVAQAMAYGGNITRVSGSFTASYQKALEAAREPGVMNLTTTFLSPYGLEGDKTMAYEMVSQLKAAPDAVVIPVGAGPVLYGIYKGFRELLRFGRIPRLPRLIAVQAEGCAPIVRGFRSRQAVRGWEEVSTFAGAIADPLGGYEGDGEITLEAVRDSGGCAIAVPDREILRWGRTLAATEGIFVEPASGAAVAGLSRLREEGLLEQGETVVCLLTGNGLKDSGAWLPRQDEMEEA